MKRIGGFTLFELVIVTVLMGILAISLAPRFMNVQDDARSATYSNLKGAFQSAVSLFHTKCVGCSENLGTNSNKPYIHA